MTVAVLGAGALGSYIGGRLAEHGASVTLIARDATRLQAIDRDGLTIEDDKGERVIKVRAAPAAALHDKIGVFLVLCKAMHTADAIQSVAHLIGPETWAVTLQNGLGNEDALATLLPPARIGIGMTDVPAGLVTPTHAKSPGSGTIRFWSMDGADSPALRAIETLLAGAGFNCVATPAIATDVWEKVAFNGALNALGAITRRANGGLDNRDGRAVADAVVDEAVAVAKALGVPVDPARIRTKIDGALTKHRLHKGSMLQDVLAGRLTEIDHINGAIVRAADQAKLPAPVNRTLVHLMKLVEAPAG
ncbi:MAG: 2-dehydropantoate 2-reductase [Alphaproteobacteria bacterium]|nr:2-dehydropantoate 2-reductase [Alphaproteobacteria bacterium]